MSEEGKGKTASKVPLLTPVKNLIYLWSDLTISVQTLLLHRMVHNHRKGCLCRPPVSSSQSDCFCRRHVDCVKSNVKSLALERDIGAKKKKLWLSVECHWDRDHVWVLHHSLKNTLQSPALQQLGRCRGRCNVTFINSWVMLNFFSCGLDMEKHRQPVWLWKL